MYSFALHIFIWLVIILQEKIDKSDKLNGYNFLTVTQSCEWGIVLGIPEEAGHTYSWLANARQKKIAPNHV